MGEACNTHDMRNEYKILIRKTEGNRSRGRSRRRKEDNIKMAVRKIGWEVVDWIHLVQDTDQWRFL